MTGNASGADSEVDAWSHDQRTEPLSGTRQSPRSKLVSPYLRTVREAERADLQRALGAQTLAPCPVVELLVGDTFVKRVDVERAVTTEHDE